MSMDRKDARAAKRAAEAKFKKLDALHKAGATKEVRKMSDSWTKRHKNNPGEFFKAKNAKPSTVMEIY